MTAAGRINAASLTRGDEILVTTEREKALWTSSGQLYLARVKRGVVSATVLKVEAVQVQGRRRAARRYVITTDQGVIEDLAPIQTMWHNGHRPESEVKALEASVATEAEQDEQAAQVAPVTTEAELDAEIERKVAERREQAGATFEQRAEIVTLAAGKPIRAHWLRMIVDLATAADGELSREDAATAIQMLRGLAAPRPKTGLAKIQTFQRRHGGLTRKGLTPKQARRVRKTIHKERKAYFELLELARTA